MGSGAEEGTQVAVVPGAWRVARWQGVGEGKGPSTPPIVGCTGRIARTLDVPLPDVAPERSVASRRLWTGTRCRCQSAPYLLKCVAWQQPPRRLTGRVPVWPVVRAVATCAHRQGRDRQDHEEEAQEGQGGRQAAGGHATVKLLRCGHVVPAGCSLGLTGSPNQRAARPICVVLGTVWVLGVT